MSENGIKKLPKIKFYHHGRCGMMHDGVNGCGTRTVARNQGRFRVVIFTTRATLHHRNVQAINAYIPV